MAKIFGVHVALHSPEAESVWFAPGDEVPEWALDLVGDHCLILPPSDEEIHEGDGSTPETHGHGSELASFTGPVTVLTAAEAAELARLEDDGAPSAPQAKGSAPLSFTGATEEPKKPAAKARGKKA